MKIDAIIQLKILQAEIDAIPVHNHWDEDSVRYVKRMVDRAIRKRIKKVRAEK